MSRVFVNILARRYADAMLQAAREKHLADMMLRDLQRVEALFEQVDGLMSALKNPALSLDNRMELITKVAKAARLNVLTVNFLKLLLKNNRLSLIDAIVAGYVEALDRANGVVRAVVITAKPMPMHLSSRIGEAIRRRMDVKRVIMEKKVDPDILGGIKVVVGDRVFDMSIQGYIDALKIRLLGGS